MIILLTLPRHTNPTSPTFNQRLQATIRESHPQTLILHDTYNDPQPFAVRQFPWLSHDTAREPLERATDTTDRAERCHRLNTSIPNSPVYIWPRTLHLAHDSTLHALSRRVGSDTGYLESLSEQQTVDCDVTDSVWTSFNGLTSSTRGGRSSDTTRCLSADQTSVQLY